MSLRHNGSCNMLDCTLIVDYLSETTEKRFLFYLVQRVNTIAGEWLCRIICWLSVQCLMKKSLNEKMLEDANAFPANLSTQLWRRRQNYKDIFLSICNDSVVTIDAPHNQTYARGQKKKTNKVRRTSWLRLASQMKRRIIAASKKMGYKKSLCQDKASEDIKTFINVNLNLRVSEREKRKTETWTLCIKTMIVK